MKGKIKLLLLTLLIGVIPVFSGCGETPAPVDEGVMVEISPVTTGDISNESRLSGKLEGEKSVNLTPKMPGKVGGVYAKMGDRVSAGQVLVSLDTSDYKAQLDQAQAAYDIAAGSFEQAKVRYNDAKVNYDRMKTLYDEGAISLQQLEQSKSAVATADTSIQQAQMSQAAAQIASIKQTLANANVVSPIGGVVSTMSAKVGEMVGQAPVATVVTIDNMLVRGNVTESQVNTIEKGSKIKVVVSALSSDPISGTVRAISPSADPQKLTYPVEIIVPNKDRKLKAGMVAEIVWAPKVKKNVITVPVDSILEDENGQFAYIMKDSKAVKVPVTVGMETETIMEITGGLTVGDQLITAGQHLVSEGSLLRTAKEE